MGATVSSMNLPSTAAVVVAGYVASKLLQNYIEFKTTPLRRIPGPPQKSWLFGYFLEILQQPFMAPHKAWLRMLTNDYTKPTPPLLSYSYLFGRWTVVVLDPEIVQEILTARDATRFPKRYTFLRSIAGKGLATLERGEEHARHRRIFQPCFQGNVVRERLQNVVPGILQRFIQAWETAADSNKVIDASSHLAALTLDILGQASFAHDFQGVATVEEWAQNGDAMAENDSLGEIPDPLIQALTSSFKITPLKIVMELLGLSSWLNTVDFKSKKTRQILDDAAGNIIQNARDKSTNASSTEQPKSRSLLEQMLRASRSESSRNQMSEQELREEIASFVVAGHETTSTWCMWALYALALDPELQERVYQDIDKHTNGNGSIGLDDIEKMDYFQAFLKEVLRMYTPVGMLFRFTSRQESWHGYTVPPDTRLCIPIHLLHRHAEQWERPKAFMPERWLESNGGPTNHKFAYIPFSDGPQNCIGYKFAECEAKLILANLIHSFKFGLDESTAKSGVSFTIFVAMKSKYPIKLKLERRQ